MRNGGRLRKHAHDAADVHRTFTIGDFFLADQLGQARVWALPGATEAVARRFWAATRGLRI